METGNWTWKAAPVALRGDEKLAWRFEAELLAAHLSGTPGGLEDRTGSHGVADAGAGEAGTEAVQLLIRLGDLYSRLGMLQDGLRVDLRLVALHPTEPVFHYNLACTHSRLRQLDPAFEALETAIRLGYDRFDHVLADQDLENLKGDDRFAKLLEQLQG